MVFKRNCNLYIGEMGLFLMDAGNLALSVLL